ncbi:MAG: hypothetical protein JEZ00_16565 [Anaerolineaceae bacterium]|nr:hypothetical protein [Anaerolineaceae bacterium]
MLELVILFLQTANQLLSAGIAITAFSILLFSLTFNLKDRVAQSFAIIMTCLVIIYSGDAIGSTSSEEGLIELWLRIQWVGLILLPAAYFHFSDALLATTGQISRWRRKWMLRLLYIGSMVLMALIPTDFLLGELEIASGPAPYFKGTLFSAFFLLYYICVLFLAWYNFFRTFIRTTTRASQRRMVYLIIAAIFPAFGSFPYLLFGSNFAEQHGLIFWGLATLMNIIIGGVIIVMTYSVSFFGVSWPNRVIKNRLLKWILRGPVAAIIVLSAVTFTRRIGSWAGFEYTGYVPLVMVGLMIMIEFAITLFYPVLERILINEEDHEQIELLVQLEERLITNKDLQQFLEMILAAVCDRLQVMGAYIIGLDDDGLELVYTIGQHDIRNEDLSEKMLEQVSNGDEDTWRFVWGNDMIIPLNVNQNGDHEIIGLLGVKNAATLAFEEEEVQAVKILAERAGSALKDRHAQQVILTSLKTLSPSIERLQQLRAAGNYDGSQLYKEGMPVQSENIEQWVRDALTHYWGGPKLTDSPLLKYQFAQDVISEHEGNQGNAMRAILQKSINSIKPEGERRFTGEWLLYNILEMKFIEGKKVREVAVKLALSEADFYRKQRIAVESIAKHIEVLENQARNQLG